MASRVGGNRNDARRAGTRRGRPGAGGRRAPSRPQQAPRRRGRRGRRREGRGRPRRRRPARRASPPPAPRCARPQQRAAVAAAREALLARPRPIARSRSAVPPIDALLGAARGPRPERRPARGRRPPGYPNGQIPTDALCPLWGTSGQRAARRRRRGLQRDEPGVRRDLRRARSASPTPTAATPAGRRPRRASPTLAAVARHEQPRLGRRASTCATACRSSARRSTCGCAHNAMAYGWFHPAWAQAGGSKPEPWHWEFAG